MKTIHRTLGNIPLPDVRVCRHLAACEVPILLNRARCANCAGYLCGDCEDDAVHCSGGTCVGLICEECQATARKRDIKRQMFDGKRNAQIPTTDYLCSPCFAKQDAATVELMYKIDPEDLLTPSIWLDDIVAKLEEAVEKAKESL
jgi:hypothetical protein